MEVAIIGAGPMGLATAYHLSRKGHSCTVYEADDRLGGMSASFDFDGTLIERYYHFINLPDETLFALLRELKMEQDLHWTPTKMGLYRSDRMGRRNLYPWGNPLALLRLTDIPLSTRLRYGFHAFACKFIKDLTPLDDLPASRWIKQWEGDSGYELLWRALFEKKFFEYADPLSAAWIASRIRRVANSRSSLMEERLGYLEHGTQSLLENLAAKIHLAGGQIRLSTPVSHVLVQKKQVIGVKTDKGMEPYKVVISTIPLPYLPSLIPDLPLEYKDRISKINNVGCACALFRLKYPISENFWLNIDINEWDIPGLIEYSNLRPMNSAHVYIPFYMPHTHPNWQKSDRELLQVARHYLMSINAKAAASEEAAVVFRYKYAQPVCIPGFRHIMPNYETGILGLYAADTSHSFPEDRSINESVRIGKELAQLLYN